MCAPKAPNPEKTAAAQTATNLATANANTIGANGNITTDDGSRTTTFENYSFLDPSSGKMVNGLKPNVVETLSPAQKAIKDQADAAKLGLNTLANKQTGKLSNYLDTPFKFDDQAHTKWATDQYQKLNGQQFADEQEQAQSRLSNMGIKMGTPAYDREMSRLEQSQGHQRDQFALDSYGEDFQTQQALRNQPINEVTALMSGGQVSQPVFNGARATTIPTTDVASIIQNDYQNRVNAAGTTGANIGGALSGAASLFALSDETTKKNIKKVGTVNGQAWHEFNYKGEPKGAPIRMGLMAQKVAKKTPEAVITGPHGKKMVNYSRALHMGA